MATFALGVAILKAAQDIMVPMAVAAVLAILLSPFVGRLRRLGVGRLTAVALTSTLAFAVLTCVGWMAVSQAWRLLGELPGYERNIDSKLQQFSALHKSAAFTRVEVMISRFEKELVAAPVSGADENSPVLVRVEQSRTNSFEAVKQLATPILAPLGAAGIVIVFVVALLLQEHDIRNRFIRLVQPRRSRAVGRLIDDAQHRIFRYLWTQLIVNVCFGTCIGMGLFVLGIPNVLMWGLLAVTLRFIPYLGPWMAAAFPLVIAIAVEASWLPFISTLGLFAVTEAVTANLIEPLVYGANTGVSGLALLFAAVFWTWLWGLPGLFLSTPLTVCLMVIGKYVPEMRFLSVLLGGPTTERPATKHSSTCVP